MSVVGLGLGITASANFEVAVEAEVIRKKVGVSAEGNAQIDTAQSQFGGASALFDGTGDYLRSTTFPALGTGDFTIEYWTRFENLPSANGYMTFDARPGSNGAYPLIYHGIGTPGDIRYFVSGADKITTGVVISADTWHHLAVVRSSGTTKLYVDGTQQGGNYTDSTDYQASSKLTIGANMNDINVLDGHIDELRVSNSARYTAAFTPPTAPFVNDDNTKLLLHMNGTDGSTFFEDDNGVRAESSLVGLGGADIDTAQSQFGGTSFYVDGTGGDGVLAYLPSNPSAITVEGWYRFDGVPSSKSCMFVHNRPSTGYGNGEWFVTYNYVLNDWSLNIKDNIGASVTRINSTANDHEDTNWHHLAVCMEIGGYARLFIDGDLEEEVDISGYTFTDWTASLNRIWIAHWYASSNNHECYYDEFRISDTIRYTTSFTAPTAPFTNDANTLLLLHADGTDGSTDFRDDNGTGRSPVGLTAIGNAQIDTAQSQFGGASALFDGTDDFLDTSYRSSILSSTETIEFWYRPTSASGVYGIMSQNTQGEGTGFQILQINGVIHAYKQASGGTTLNGGSLSANTWVHVAVVNNNGSAALYIDGTSVDTDGSWSGTDDDTDLRIGEGKGISSSLWDAVRYDMNGHLDEVRISDTARYTAAFTPSTETFQNDANTLLLLHMDGTDGSTVFIDDNGKHPPA